MTKFLIIEQDLKISGTSQGIISRSFLAKLRMAYPNAIIDVVYLKSQPSDDQLHLLPVDSIDTHILNLKIPFFTKWINKLYWRIFHVSLAARHINSVYGTYISKIDYQNHDHIFIRSAGLDCETILGAKDLPILKRAIITFNEPYPTFWCTGSETPLTNLGLFKHKEMYSVVSQSKSCMATESLAEDMEYLYGSRKKFHIMPHHYSETVFDLSDNGKVLKKNKKITISYHGAIQFGRNADILLDAYQELVTENPLYKENTEFILRLRGKDNKRLTQKYLKCENILVLDTLNFSNSAYEQVHIADINIILENGPLYCNILVGKAPFLASFGKPVLSISPKRSELRKIVKDKQYIADCENKEEIKQKLENLIINRLNSKELVSPFGDYFSDENFIKMMNTILAD
ncbi:MAG: hypothetical protein V4535_08990 [Bacteroidota bacterium]